MSANFLPKDPKYPYSPECPYPTELPKGRSHNHGISTRYNVMYDKVLHKVLILLSYRKVGHITLEYLQGILSCLIRFYIGILSVLILLRYRKVRNLTKDPCRPYPCLDKRITYSLVLC